MSHIIADNISLLFPFVGSDNRFRKRMRSLEGDNSTRKVGGKIVANEGFQSGIQALDNLSLHLKDGDRLGIFGHNGAGKTTLLRVLAGIYPPTSGRMSIDGRVTGMFSLGLGINKEVSGFENIIIKGIMYGLKKREITALATDIIEFSELSNYIHMPVKTYSSGMSLRLQFSIASALKPDILLMDEWISSADKRFKVKMDERLEQMVHETPIVIIASHSEDRLYGWANSVICMDNGRVVSMEDTRGYESKQAKFIPDPAKLLSYNRLLNFSRNDEAFAMVDQVWPKAEDPLTYYSKVATYYFKKNDFPKATEAYERLIELTPDNPKIHDQFGRLCFKNGEYHIASKHIFTALELSSGTIGDIVAYRSACEKINHPDMTESLFKEP